ncbi:hypothetical protein PAPYR_11934 [Paratrimastix pyriformis]|uniref:Uncharacterized protein n=1 Tax=Paratrimastix pyriformis TaxID=342808 RepID=A0ABQ8U2T4_9EUKA|nr:hypothetical protein PAPYR_11934 [Paratrimastix pyriformis]
MLVVSLLAMSQTLRSHSSTCDSEIRTITGHARNSFRAQVLLKPVFHLGLIDLVAREGEYSERSESLLNNRPVNVWLRPSSRGRVVAEPMLSRGKAGGFYNNAHCELLPLQHTLAVAREELHLFWARTRGAANSPVSDRRHDDSMSHMEPWRSPPHVSEVRNNFGISALLGLEIGENSLTASKPHSCTSFLNGFSSDPVCAVTPAPEVVFFPGGPSLADIS